MREIADEVGAKIMYDGAHVLGLIAGGEFQDPLSEGAFVLTGSTTKTLSCSLGGLILYNDPSLDKRIHEIMDVSAYVAGYNAARVAHLAVALAEYVEFGREFYVQVVKNAQALGKALDEEGFNVVGKVKGYTKSHMVLVDVSRIGGGMPVSKTLDKINIISSPVTLYNTGDGVRLGTAPVTRYGMRESEMTTIAKFIRRAVRDKEDPEMLIRDVADFRKPFSRVHYCFS